MHYFSTNLSTRRDRPAFVIKLTVCMAFASRGTSVTMLICVVRRELADVDPAYCPTTIWGGIWFLAPDEFSFRPMCVKSV